MVKTFVTEAIVNFKQIGSFLPTNKSAVKKMVNTANISKSDKVLDVGAGDGIITVEAAQKVGDRGLVVGIEINHQLYMEAIRKLNSLNLQNIVMINGDAFNIKRYIAELQIDKFDATLSSVPITCIDNPIKYLKILKSVTSGKIIQLTYWPFKTIKYFKKAGIDNIEISPTFINLILPGTIISGEA